MFLPVCSYVIIYNIETLFITYKQHFVTPDLYNFLEKFVSFCINSYSKYNLVTPDLYNFQSQNQIWTRLDYFQL